MACIYRYELGEEKKNATTASLENLHHLSSWHCQMDAWLIMSAEYRQEQHIFLYCCLWYIQHFIEHVWCGWWMLNPSTNWIGSELSQNIIVNSVGGTSTINQKPYFAEKKNYNEKRNIHQQATTMLSYATESCNLTRQRDIDKQTVIQVQWTGHARASSPSRTWWQKKQHSTFMQIKQHLIYISSIREKEMKFDIAKYDIFFCDIIELIVLIRKWFKPPNRAFLSLSLYLSFPFIRFTLFPLSSSRG